MDLSGGKEINGVEGRRCLQHMEPNGKIYCGNNTFPDYRMISVDLFSQGKDKPAKQKRTEQIWSLLQILPH